MKIFEIEDEAERPCCEIGEYEMCVVPGEVFMSTENTENFFSKYGLEVASGDVEVGKTYPIYGMITKFLNDVPGEILVELNFSILAQMTIPDDEKVNFLKERAFEPGIFVSKVIAKDDGVRVDCTTVVFGKKRHQYEA